MKCIKALCLFACLWLTACGGDSGITPGIGNDSGEQNAELTSNENSPVTTSSSKPVYTGPAPISDDIQRFKNAFWDILRDDNRCGACHGTGGQQPSFVREDDVNLAYQEALTIVDQSSVSESRVVSKVAGGHNCWVDVGTVCGDIITGYINNWLNPDGGSATEIELRAPQLAEPGDSKNFPADSSVFTGVHTLLTTYCSGCHNDTVSNAISPYFASADIDAAYAAAQSKIDLETPGFSRLVVRLRNEFHNCWSQCTDNANEMQNAIQALSDGINTTQLDPDLINSKALTLPDGIVISGGGRIDTDAIALYQFKTGSGNVAYDTSGIDPAMNLTLSGTQGTDFQWVGGWGIRNINSKAQALTSSSQKLYNQIAAIGEYSIEAWIAPGNVSQEGPAVIIGYNGGTTARNFSLGQTLYNYDFLNRSSETNANGEAALSTPDDDEILQATQQHVVATFDPVNGRLLYVNGELIETDTPDSGGGTLSDWDNSFAFVLGNETSSNRLWQGTFRFVAVHKRALSASEVSRNFEAGVGERFYLLFSITDIINVPDSYIVFEVSQFDSYSYLFSTPFYISLNANAALSNIPLRAMRIGINGREAGVGQAWRNLDITLDSSKLDPESGAQFLVENTLVNTPKTAQGSIIPLEKGPQADEFFLTFELLGSQSHVVVEATPDIPQTTATNVEVPDIGLRTFDEINTTVSAITGVSTQQSDVKALFETIYQQLPGTENIESFLSAQQMGITQLAIEYCNALVDDGSLRSTFFSGFDFNADANGISDSDWTNGVINPLLNAAIGSGLASQPDQSDVRTELLTLINDSNDIKPIGTPDGIPDGLAKCGGNCGSGRTAIVVKATCAAAIGNAAMLLQ